MIERPKSRASRDSSKPVVWKCVEEWSFWQSPYETPNAFLAQTICQNIGKRGACLPFGSAERRNAVGEMYRKSGTAGIRENVIVPILGRGRGDRYFFRFCTT